MTAEVDGYKSSSDSTAWSGAEGRPDYPCDDFASHGESYLKGYAGGDQKDRDADESNCDPGRP
jgi:hypothetical protein